MYKTYTIRITGRVQGVGFRNYIYRTAVDQGILGMVRNEADGSVSVLASMPDTTVRSFVEALKQGNGFSKVSCIKITESEPKMLSGFSVIYG